MPAQCVEEGGKMRRVFAKPAVGEEEEEVGKVRVERREDSVARTEEEAFS